MKFLVEICLKGQSAATRLRQIFQRHPQSTYNEILEKNMHALSVEEIEEISGGNLPESSVGGDTDPR